MPVCIHAPATAPDPDDWHEELAVDILIGVAPTTSLNFFTRNPGIILRDMLAMAFLLGMERFRWHFRRQL